MSAEAGFVVVAKVDELSDPGFLRLTVEGHALVLARSGDCFYAFEGTCPHERTDLALGRIEHGRLICPRHLASFDLADGGPSAGWKLDPLKLYPVRLKDGEVAVDGDAVRRNPPGGARKIWDLANR